MTEKRYLVYKSWNGQIHTSIEYGELTDGEGKQKSLNELERFEIFVPTDDIKLLKEIYPINKLFELASSNKELKNEETAVNS